MTSNMVIYALVGPKRIRLTAGRRKNILNFCNELVDAAKAVVGGNPTKSQLKLVEKLDECEQEDLAETNPEKVLAAFLDLWNNSESSQDISLRTHTITLGKKNYQVLLAKDMTGSETPGSYGYLTIKMAGKFGLLFQLGIQ